MPPRATGRGRGGSTAAGQGRGGSARVHQPATPAGLPADHVNSVGVKRPGFGVGGKAITLQLNAFPTTIPDKIIYHYDVIHPVDKVLPPRFNMLLIQELQRTVAPEIFSPKGVYDGRKNFFSIIKLPFHEGTKDFNVSLEAPTKTRQPPKAFKIRLTLVAEINPEALHRFVAGTQSQDSAVQTAITALNVVIRMTPSLNHPFNARSFFPDNERQNIGGGLEVRRGLFQSIRPGLDKVFINVDIATGVMYKPGPLIDVCLEFLAGQQGMQNQTSNVQQLSPPALNDRNRLALQRFISGVRIDVTSKDSTGPRRTKVIKKLTSRGAGGELFNLNEGGNISVANYYSLHQNRPLRFPNAVCVEVGTSTIIPLELCSVVPGQIMRKQVPDDKRKAVLEFSTKKPADRLASIKNGIPALQYQQSEYVAGFGLRVDVEHGPLRVQARILQPPTLRYGEKSKVATIAPRDGAWNMRDKKFIKPSTAIDSWMLVSYETERRFSFADATKVINNLVVACQEVGINLAPTTHIDYHNAQGNIEGQLNNFGSNVLKDRKKPPQLILAILPEGGNDTYVAVKHFGDVVRGVPTQCLKATKCRSAKPQYFANVCLKLNVKLGGINAIPDPRSVQLLSDPKYPTIVMGADVVHPAPGADGKPSFTSVVGNVDSGNAKYIATCGVQTSRQEMIEDLEERATHVLKMYMDYRKYAEKKAEIKPKRLIFYRDGVSEGQFSQVLDLELPALKRACRTLDIDPKITFIVVGKRHHIRFFPTSGENADKSGNSIAGTVVDREIVHPVDFDFYLQSHGGLLGTSRPAHYSVLYDDSGFKPDELQSLSFALCHVYARSTRSVSIPAPVYYADIVCARAKNHYTPGATGMEFSDSASQMTSNQANASLQMFREGFKPVHPNQTKLMYFS